MNREFGYSWQRPKAILLAVPLVIGYATWRHGDFGVVDAVVVTCVVGWSAIIAFSAMCKVLVTKSEIHVTFLLPFRRGGQFPTNQIESYAEIAFQRKDRRVPLGGMLKPTGEKQVMLLSAGTQDFAELNTLLSEMFPRPEMETEQNIRQVSPEAAPSASPDEPSM